MTKRRSKLKLNSRVAFAIVGSLVILAFAVQTLFIRQLSLRVDKLQTQDIKATLIDSMKSLNTEPAVDPITGRRSFPAYRVVLPAKSESHVYYRGAGESSTLWLTDANNQLRAFSKVRLAETNEGVFKEVASAQMCSRQIVVSFDVTADKYSDDKLTLKATKTLKDGRRINIYQNECPFGAEPILRDLEKIDSY